jgi:choline dehydrogenase-like flavoprotein
MQATLADATDWATCGDANAEVIVVADVIIIGSGAGGATAAAVLAQSGLRVLVLEKGGYVHPEGIAQCDSDAIRLSYECGQFVATGDTGVTRCSAQSVTWCRAERSSFDNS